MYSSEARRVETAMCALTLDLELVDSLNLIENHADVEDRCRNVKTGAE
jgi:hypothetical protein